MSNQDSPVEVVCRYLVKPGKSGAFEDLLKRHWSTLDGLGLTDGQPARLLRAGDKAGNTAYIERFAWRTGTSADTAHESPEVMMLWEPMGVLCQDMEFWNVEEI